MALIVQAFARCLSPDVFHGTFFNLVPGTRRRPGLGSDLAHRPRHAEVLVLELDDEVVHLCRVEALVLRGRFSERRLDWRQIFQQKTEARWLQSLANDVKGIFLVLFRVMFCKQQTTVIQLYNDTINKAATMSISYIVHSALYSDLHRRENNGAQSCPNHRL